MGKEGGDRKRKVDEGEGGGGRGKGGVESVD